MLEALLKPGSAVATHGELRAVGLSSSTIMRRISRSGPWQRVLPGVVAGHSGILTLHERRLAALAYAGPASVLTGIDALDLLGVRLGALRRTDRVHVLIPHASQRTSHGFALVTRTRRTGQVVERSGLRCSTAARALVEACRRVEEIGAVRELVAAVVQQGFCTPEDIAREIAAAARQRTALSREVLAEVAAGVRSAAEAALREGFTRLGVPQPRWNAQFRNDAGELEAVADAWWEDVDGVLEINSVEWHLKPADFKRTEQRARRIVISGRPAISVLPSEIRDDIEGVCREVMAFRRACAAMRGLDTAA